MLEDRVKNSYLFQRGMQQRKISPSLLADFLCVRGAEKDPCSRGRVEEIAKMLGGEKVTDISRKHAKEMLTVK